MFYWICYQISLWYEKRYYKFKNKAIKAKYYCETWSEIANKFY